MILSLYLVPFRCNARHVFAWRSKNARDIKAADALLDQVGNTKTTHPPDSNTTNSTSDPFLLYRSQYQRLVIVFRRGRYQEYTHDSGRPISHQELQQAAYHNLQMRQYTFGAIPDQLIERNLYTRQQLYDMGAHRYICAPEIMVS